MTININDFNTIYNLNASGMTIKQIAKEFSTTEGCIARLFGKMGVTYKTFSPKPPNYIDIDIKEVEKLYLAGYSVLKMSKYFGVSRSVITKRINELGYKTRTGSEANIIRFKNSTLEERKAITKQANISLRGKKYTQDKRIARAIKRENTAKELFERYPHLGAGEIEIFQYLRDNKLSPTLQKAIHIYNIDIFISPNICIEVSSTPHPFKSQCITKRRADDFIEKVKYLTNNGFVVCEINFRDVPALLANKDNLITFFQGLSITPTIMGQHFMISCYYPYAPVPKGKDGKFIKRTKPKKSAWKITKIDPLTFG